MWTDEYEREQTAKLHLLRLREDRCEWIRTALRLLEIGSPLPNALALGYEQLQQRSVECAAVVEVLERWVLPVRGVGDVDVEQLLRASVLVEKMLYTVGQTLRKRGG